MPLQIDQVNKIVQVTSPTVTVDAQTLHDFIEDYMASPVGMTNDSTDPSFLGDIIKPEGKIADPTNPVNRTLIVLIFNSEWQVQFWPGSGVTRITGGKILGGVGDVPVKATGAAGDITILESPVDGTTSVVATGSAVTEQDKLDIADRVWDETLADHNNVGSTGDALDNVSGGSSPETIAAAVWANTKALTFLKWLGIR